MTPADYEKMCIDSTKQKRAEMIGKKVCKLDKFARVLDDEPCRGEITSAEIRMEEFEPGKFASRILLQVKAADGVTHEVFADQCKAI